MLSHHHKTIFVHIPKCAGQSVESAFLEDIGLTWETRAPLLLRTNDRPELGPFRLAHLIAQDYVRCGYVPQEMFDSYFRFAIVRDPWSRAVSQYRHLDMNMPFNQFVADWLPREFESRDWSGQFWFVRPQTDFVMQDGKLAVNEVLRLENLAADFDRAASASGLASPLPHVNRSSERKPRKPRSFSRRLKAALQPDRRDRHEQWRDFYDPQTVAGIGQLYGADVETFGYQPPEPGGRAT
mgnify:FL=1